MHTVFTSQLGKKAEGGPDRLWPETATQASCGRLAATDPYPPITFELISRLMKQNLFLFVIAASLVGCVSNSPIEDLPIAVISVDGESLIYRGSISRASNDRLFKLVEPIDFVPTTLVITSKGGETTAGIELGQWVFRNRLDVTVTEYCLSSCANYVFPAGLRKTLEPSAALAWHGGSMQEEWGDPCSNMPKSVKEEGLGCADIKRLQRESLEEFKTAEKSFFAEIGVDQRVTVLGQYPEYVCRERTNSLGWDYSIEDMGRLGIKNIQVRNGEWRPESPAPNLTICRVDLGEDFS